MTEQEQRISDDLARAQIANLNAQTAKLNKETQWYEALILSGMLAAGAALAKLLF